jgi:hypothetical protein
MASKRFCHRSIGSSTLSLRWTESDRCSIMNDPAFLRMDNGTN